MKNKGKKRKQPQYALSQETEDPNKIFFLVILCLLNFKTQVKNF